jgi:hypothetical protein
MPHPRPDLEIDLHSGSGCSISQPLGITEKNFVVANLNPQRWKTRQVHFRRAKKRAVAVSPDVHGSGLPALGGADQGIQCGPRRKRISARLGPISHRGHQERGTRQWNTFILE